MEVPADCVPSRTMSPGCSCQSARRMSRLKATNKDIIVFSHFFLPPLSAASAFCSHEMTLPSITTPLPSMKATRERPSQFLKLSQTSGCCGMKLHSAISLDFREWGSSIFFPPVSFPIFHLSAEMRRKKDGGSPLSEVQ